MIYTSYQEAIAVALNDIERQLIKLNKDDTRTCDAIKQARSEIIEYLNNMPSSKKGKLGCDSPSRWQFAINLTL